MCGCDLAQQLRQLGEVHRHALRLVTSLATGGAYAWPGKNGKAKTVCRASSFTIIIKAGSLYPLSFRSSRIVHSA
jgi:hypothetical protein